MRWLVCRDQTGLLVLALSFLDALSSEADSSIWETQLQGSTPRALSAFLA